MIGVVKDFTRFNLGVASEPGVLFDARQRPALPGAEGMSPYLVARTERRLADALPDIKAAVSRVDRDAAVVNAAAMEAIVGHAVSRPRLYASMMSIFAAGAMLIAAVGLYGVVAYAVAQRTRDIGVHLALGATPRRVMAVFFVKSARLAAFGIAIGLGAAAALSRYLEGLLFGVSPWEPASFVTATVIVVGVATVATVVPTWRAARVDPLVTLRVE